MDDLLNIIWLPINLDNQGIKYQLHPKSTKIGESEKKYAYIPTPVNNIITCIEITLKHEIKRFRNCENMHPLLETCRQPRERSLLGGNGKHPI